MSVQQSNIPDKNMLVRIRAVQGQNKGRDSSGLWIGPGFMVYPYILRCGRRIIRSLGEIRCL